MRYDFFMFFMFFMSLMSLMSLIFQKKNYFKTGHYEIHL